MSRRTIALLVVACLVAGTVAAFGRDLVRDLVSGALAEPAAPARPLSAAEAGRLASMRQHNWDEGAAGVRATIGRGADQVQAVGWVDWRHPVVYLALSRGGQPPAATELVQAVPDLIATRPATDAPAAPTSAATDAPTAPTSAAGDMAPAPPAEPPRDGWRVRRPGAEGRAGAPGAPGTIDTLAALLLTIGSDGPDAADQLARSDSQWLRRDRTGGYEVDVLLGPAVPPSPVPSPEPAPNLSLAAMGGAVQYWLDGDGRLHRLEALLAVDTPVRIDLDRADNTAPVVLDLLGGAAVDPRPVTEDEVASLSQLRQRNLAAGGGEITVTLPDRDGKPVRAAGWLDWQRTVVYLARSADGADDADGELLWAGWRGIASHENPPAGNDPPPGDGASLLPPMPPMPPLPAPAGTGWQWSAWEQRADEYGGFDLDLLLNEVLGLGGWELTDLDRLRATAAWLRADEVAGTPVGVYELPRDFEAELTPGEARMRYWVGESGLLRRLEIRTRTGGFGQLDLAPGPVPELGSVS